MGVLVLGDNFGDVNVWRLALAPAHHVSQGLTLRERLLDLRQHVGDDWLCGADRNGPHTKMYEPVSV